MQFVVTDGSTFTDIQTRDTTYTVRSLDPTGMACEVTSKARSGKYTIVTDYITDPARDAVLIKVRFQAKSTAFAVSCGSTPASTATAGAAPTTAAPTTRRSMRPPARSSPATRTRRPTRSTATTPCRPRWRCEPTGRSWPRAAVSPAPTSDSLVQLQADPFTWYDVPDRHRRQRRADGPAGHVARRRHARARLRPHRRGRGRHGRCRAAAAVPTHLRGVRGRLVRLRRAPAPPAGQRVRHVLPVGQRPQVERGQDVPGRGRRVAGQPVGAGGQRRLAAERPAGLLRLVPRGVLPRPVRGVHRPAHRR